MQRIIGQYLMNEVHVRAEGWGGGKEGGGHNENTDANERRHYSLREGPCTTSQLGQW